MLYFRTLALLGLIFNAQQGWSATKVTYPSTSSLTFAPYIDLLKQALKKSGKSYDVVPSENEMTEARYLVELKKNELVDVIWSSTSEEKESEMIPIRIPLDRGLLGYRVSFISSKNKEKFSGVKSKEDLLNFTLGQGIGWGDVDLYKQNGFKVSVGQYEKLFEKVARGDFDLFPRGIGEVFMEFETMHGPNPDLAIEDKLCIYYPWPYYYFVNKKSVALAEDLKNGLEKMIKDKSFDRHFNKYYAESIKAANLSKRTIINIINPLLPKSTPLDRKELWYRP